ncbi:hypothetical protein THAOC_08055, partial [Thalassiosira oceanica]
RIKTKNSGKREVEEGEKREKRGKQPVRIRDRKCTLPCNGPVRAEYSRLPTNEVLHTQLDWLARNQRSGCGDHFPQRTKFRRSATFAKNDGWGEQRGVLSSVERLSTPAPAEELVPVVDVE